MDHFAKPQDELAVAQREGNLHRNFQGYTTQGDCDLLGLGVSAISMIGDRYAQNQKSLNDWYSQVEKQGHALWRGFTLSQDDCLRRDVIKTLICNFALDFSATETQWNITFDSYFAEELARLKTADCGWAGGAKRDRPESDRNRTTADSPYLYVF